MAYISTEEFDKSIEDCDSALSLNKDFVKVTKITELTNKGLLQEGFSIQRETGGFKIY